MSSIEVFAAFILLELIATAVGVFVILSVAPGYGFEEPLSARVRKRDFDKPFVGQPPRLVLVR